MSGVPISFVALDELLGLADFVVLWVPLTDETRGMIDRAALAKMRPSVHLVNVARGPIVATDDLLDALREGRIAAAGLDVTDPEPLPPDHRIRGLPNVLVSPHNAGRTHESQAEALQRMRENVRLVLAGGPPLDLVAP